MAWGSVENFYCLGLGVEESERRIRKGGRKEGRSKGDEGMEEREKRNCIHLLFFLFFLLESLFYFFYRLRESVRACVCVCGFPSSLVVPPASPSSLRGGKKRGKARKRHCDRKFVTRELS